MKKRVVTAIILAIILIPLIFVKALFPLLQVIIILFCGIATMEMINMCQQKRRFRSGSEF